MTWSLGLSSTQVHFRQLQPVVASFAPDIPQKIWVMWENTLANRGSHVPFERKLLVNDLKSPHCLVFFLSRAGERNSSLKESCSSSSSSAFWTSHRALLSCLVFSCLCRTLPCCPLATAAGGIHNSPRSLFYLRSHFITELDPRLMAGFLPKWLVPRIAPKVAYVLLNLLLLA